MSLNVGSKKVSQMFVGNKPVKEVYKGSQLVWSANPNVVYFAANSYYEGSCLFSFARDTKAFTQINTTSGMFAPINDKYYINATYSGRNLTLQLCDYLKNNVLKTYTQGLGFIPTDIGGPVFGYDTNTLGFSFQQNTNDRAFVYFTVFEDDIGAITAWDLADSSLQGFSGLSVFRDSVVIMEDANDRIAMLNIANKTKSLVSVSYNYAGEYRNVFLQSKSNKSYIYSKAGASITLSRTIDGIETAFLGSHKYGYDPEGTLRRLDLETSQIETIPTGDSSFTRDRYYSDVSAYDVFDNGKLDYTIFTGRNKRVGVYADGQFTAATLSGIPSRYHFLCPQVLTNLT